jgi:hypothetical protein
MTWTKASAVAEIFSSAAILITLLYLVVEIGQNTAALQATSRQELLAADQNFTMTFVDNPDLDSLPFKTELTDDEKTRLAYHTLTFMRMRENAWLQYENGALDEPTWISYRGAIVNILGSPRMRVWWQRLTDQGILDPEFASMVHELLADSPPRDGPIQLTFID